MALAAPQQVGFGDATDADIAEIRAGTYLETFDDNPQYNFNYKISDETEQTYLAMDESRSGESVTGSYSYVDPNGALITVNYVAGPEGYSETRDVQENFVQIRPRPVKNVAVASSPANGGFSVSGGSSSRPAAQNTFTVLSPSSSSSSQLASSSSSSLQSDIVSQVVSQVQPLISQSVSSAVAGASRRPVAAAPAPVKQQQQQVQQVDIVSQVISEIQPLLSQTVSSAISGGSTSGSRFSAVRPAPVAAAPAPRAPAPRAQAPAPRPIAQASRTTGSVTDLFGSSGDFNVRFNTPSFKIEY